METILVIDGQPKSRRNFVHFLLKRLPEMKLVLVDDQKDLDSLEGIPVFDVIVICPGAASDLYNTLRLIGNAERAFPKVPVMIYDDHSDVEDIPLFFQTGVWGFVSKTERPDEVAACVTSLLNGKKYISEQTQRLLFGGTGNAGKSEECCSWVLKILSPRQLEIAQLLCQAFRIGDIARKLSINSSTVSNTRTLIFRRMGVKSIAELRRVMNAELPT